MNRLLIIVDPQNDFCDPEGSLYVPDAEKDCDRIAKIIQDFDFGNIFVTMDMHHEYSMYHNIFWNEYNEQYITVNKDNYLTKYTPRNIHDIDRIKNMFICQRNKQIDVWPVHCVIGEWGSSIHPVIANALSDYTVKNTNRIRYVFKGLDPYEEEYSAFSIPSKSDGKEIFFRWMDSYLHHSEIYICGEAASHCVKQTLLDIMHFVGRRDKYDYKIKLITNATSYVKGFESVKEDVYDKINDPHFEMIEI